MSQAVLILIKPDGLKKSLTGNILTAGIEELLAAATLYAAIGAAKSELLAALGELLA